MSTDVWLLLGWLVGVPLVAAVFSSKPLTERLLMVPAWIGVWLALALPIVAASYVEPPVLALAVAAILYFAIWGGAYLLFSKPQRRT